LSATRDTGLGNAALVGLLAGVVALDARGAGTHVDPPDEVAAAYLAAAGPAGRDLRRRVGGAEDAPVVLARWRGPLGLAIDAPAEDRAAFAAAARDLAAPLGLAVEGGATSGPTLTIHVVPRDAFARYDQDARSTADADVAWSRRVGPDGAIERARLLVAAELAPAERAARAPRLLAAALGLAALPLGPAPLAPAERDALAMLYDPALPLGAALPGARPTAPLDPPLGPAALLWDGAP
jgi:hypothetical protein